ncbi:MAG: hypothetical protein CMM58_07240 [Rhodospirillaceae bacterium]|nr:hypothetical protein [Rhodospirillaceae bacterium]|tara:strand:+ start:221 stop:571 length:351 start_codon:yes stop_codon:yes gene_type:complete
MDEVKEVDADTRQGLRILADSTKLKGTEGVARRLHKAAETGTEADYQQAETIFDSLPVDKRETIKVTAETKAETIKLTNQKRKQANANKPTEIEPKLDAKDELDALKEEMQQALKG